MIPADFVQKVKDASDIVQVISRHVALKKAGSSMKGLCPFHQERTPSFNVTPSKQMFYCYGCQEGGDVVAFLMKKERLAFNEAVTQLAQAAGIEMPAEQERDPEADAKARERERLQALLKDAGEWFRRNLKDSPEADEARAYAVKRGLKAEDAERFGLGYSPRDPQALERAAQKKGYSREELIRAGLLGESEGRVYSRFRGRLMFDILDARGQMCGFGGRVIGEGEPKYLNSPETTLFDKGRLLYLLPLAKEAMLKKKRALICEGYLDAIACHQAGVSEVVATLGTALSDEHAKALRRYVDRVLLVFDADNAGLRAAIRGAEALLKAGLEPRVVRLDGAKDPDEFLKLKGKDAFENRLDEAQDAIEFMAEAGLKLAAEAAVKQGRPELSLRERAAVLQSLFPVLARYATAMESEAQLRRAAEKLGLDTTAVKADFESYRQSGALTRLIEREDKELEAAKIASAPSKADPALAQIQRVEEDLLALLATHPELGTVAVRLLPEPDFQTAEAKAAAKLMWAHPGVPVMRLPSAEDEEGRVAESLLSRLTFEGGDRFPAPEVGLRLLIKRRKTLLLKRDRTKVMAELDSMAGSEGEKDLLAKLMELNQAMKVVDSEF